jgi:hypothetical protein
MRRRDVLASLVGVAVLWPLALNAQDARKIYRVGLLWDSPAMFPKAIEALREGPTTVRRYSARELVSLPPLP